MARYDDWNGKTLADSHRALHRPYRPETDDYGPERDAQPHEMTLDQFSRQPDTLWHGSPAGQMGSGVIHAGSQAAAYEAMTATLLGANARELDWQPGQSIAELDETIRARREIHPNMGRERDPWMTAPKIFPVQINPERIDQIEDLSEQFPHEDIGDMQDSSDEAANNRIRKDSDEGYFYTNMSEDAGSRSIVVPSSDWLMTHEDFLIQAIKEGHAVDEDVLADYPHLQPRLEVRTNIEHTASVHALVGEKEIGRLTLNMSPVRPDAPPVIAGVEVQKPWRRRNVATDMLDKARSIWPDLKHNTHVTPEGKAWALATDHPAPRPALQDLNSAADTPIMQSSDTTDIRPSRG